MTLTPLRRVARREASRAMMALRYGFPVGGVDIKIDPQTGAASGNARIGAFAPLLSLDDAGAFLRHRLKIVYAGPVGQALAERPEIAGEPDALATLDDTHDDLVRAGELLSVLRAIEYPGDQFDLDVPDLRTAELRSALVRSTRDILARPKFADAVSEAADGIAAAHHGGSLILVGGAPLRAIGERYGLALTA